MRRVRSFIPREAKMGKNSMSIFPRHCGIGSGPTPSIEGKAGAGATRHRS